MPGLKNPSVESSHASNCRSSQKQRQIVQAEKKRLDSVCSQMESIFLEYMLNQMRKTVPQGGVIAQSNAIRIYQDMYDRELSRELSRQKSLGLAALIKEQLSLNTGVNK